jgi:hypothetical protein
VATRNETERIGRSWLIGRSGVDPQVYYIAVLAAAIGARARPSEREPSRRAHPYGSPRVTLAGD